MKPNISEIEAIIGHIEAHPEEWNQHVWARHVHCGTAYCLAGHAVVRAGAEIRWDERRTLAELCVLHGRTYTIGSAAREILGLTSRQADHLFNGVNSIQDLKRITKNITNGEL